MAGDLQDGVEDAGEALNGAGRGEVCVLDFAQFGMTDTGTVWRFRLASR